MEKTQIEINKLSEKAEALANKRLTGEKEEDYLVELKQIPDTPFSAAKKEEKWYIIWGDIVLIGGANNYEECLELFNTRFWEILARYCIAANQIWLKDQENKQ